MMKVFSPGFSPVLNREVELYIEYIREFIECYKDYLTISM